MKKFSLCVLFLLAFASCALANIKNSPAGFRDVTWGDNLTVLGNNAIKTYSSSSIDLGSFLLGCHVCISHGYLYV